MKKEGKNLDELLKAKLSGEAYPFKEAYWQSAQQVIKANGVKAAASGFAFSKFTIALSVVLVSITSFGLGWYVFSPDTNTNQNEVVTIQENYRKSSPKPLVEENSSSNQNNKEAQITETLIISSTHELRDKKEILVGNKVNSNKEEETEIKPENKMVFSTHPVDAQKPTEEISEKPSHTTTNFNNLQTITEELLSEEISSPISGQEPLEIDVNNTSSNDFGNNESIAVLTENRFNIEKLNALGLDSYVPSSELNALNIDEKLKKSNYYEFGFAVQTYASFKSKVEEWNTGASFILRKQLGQNFLIGTGLQYEQTTARHSFTSSIINQIETEYENTFIQEDLIEKTRLVPGIVYIQGVPMQGMVEETYFDTVSTTVTETLTRTSLDTNEVLSLENYKAKYIDIPVELSYSVSFGKLDFRLGVVPSIGFLSSYSRSLAAEGPVLVIPKQRFMVAGTTQLGYYLSPKLNLNIGFGYRQNFNALVGGNNQIGGNIGLRYTF